jgi:hypothetical protein
VGGNSQAEWDTQLGPSASAGRETGPRERRGVIAPSPTTGRLVTAGYGGLLTRTQELPLVSQLLGLALVLLWSCSGIYWAYHTTSREHRTHTQPTRVSRVNASGRALAFPSFPSFLLPNNIQTYTTYTHEPNLPDPTSTDSPNSSILHHIDPSFFVVLGLAPAFAVSPSLAFGLSLIPFSPAATRPPATCHPNSYFYLLPSPLSGFPTQQAALSNRSSVVTYHTLLDFWTSGLLAFWTLAFPRARSSSGL